VALVALALIDTAERVTKYRRAKRRISFIIQTPSRQPWSEKFANPWNGNSNSNSDQKKCLATYFI
jgi:hypothetical protein